MMQFMLMRRSLLTVFITVILLAIVGLVILSPLALAGIAHFRSDWIQLSNIGQTYGAISAILSALALGGILASLLYQARDSRIAHEQMIRTFQFELIKLELDDPSLAAAMGAPWDGIPSDSRSIREFLYVQMWVSYWAGIYSAGEIPAAVARRLASDELFRGRAGRIYWSAAGRPQLATSKGRRHQFFELLDDEYTKIIHAGVPVVGPINDDTASVLSAAKLEIPTKSLERTFIITLIAIAVILAKRLWRCNGQ